jgi:hypothetical protein
LPALCFPEIAFGKPFPWTAEKIEAAKSLADELENLSAEDRAALKITIDDVAGGGPRAEAGAARLKRMLGKATTTAGQALYRIVVDVASEATKKMLLGWWLPIASRPPRLHGASIARSRHSFRLG